jgi:tetratricopeptide (TPR) repeat protein
LKKVDGFDLSLVAKPMTYLANALVVAKELEEAQRYATEAVAIMKKCFGHEDARTSEALELLGDVLDRNDDEKGASEKYAEVLRINDKFSRWPDNTACINFLHKYASALICAENFAEVVRISPRLLALFEKEGKRDDGKYNGSLVNYAVSLSMLDRDDAAISTFERALRVCERLPESIDYMTTLEAAVAAFAKKHDYPRAIELAKKALSISKRLTGAFSTRTMDLHALVMALELEEADPNLVVRCLQELGSIMGKGKRK